MGENTPIVSKEMHIAIGKNLFNNTWDLIEKVNRTPEEDEWMLHTAHASRYHWEAGGCAAVNLARGEWQISRVNAILNRAAAAIHHGELSLSLCLENKIGDFDLAFAYEALSRAFKAANQTVECRKYYQLALDASKDIKETEDLDLFLKELSTIQINLETNNATI